MKQKLIASTQSSSHSPISIDFEGLFGKYANPETLAYLSIFLVLIVVSQGGSKKGKISTGKLAGQAEKLSANRLAHKQIKERQHNRVCFWCGTPQYWYGKSLSWLQTMLGSSPSVWIPHAERSSLVLGAPGSGKTFGTIDRMMESCIRQGFPLIVYAKKEEQMKFVAPLAALHGYDVRIFAPGEDYSEVINPLDFMKDSEDQVSAGQIAEVINGNANLGGQNKGNNDFFDKAAILLVKGLIQLAKSAQNLGYEDCADLATVSALLSTDKFIDKLEFAIANGKISRWIASSFQQYLSAKPSDKTVASIDTTTVGIFSAFIQKSLLPSFVGKSTIDTKLKGKQIIIFKLDDDNREVVGPILAAAIHMTIVKNLSTPRTDPLGIFIDELPSMYLKALPQWINEYRSNGACFVLGVQSIKQLTDAYGENLARAIISACSTKFLYNPGNLETAKEFSDMYGQKDVLTKNKSVSNNRREGRNVTFNEHLQTMPVITPDEIMRLPQGRCIITNPGYSSNSEGSIPHKLKIPIPQKDIKLIKKCEKLWDKVKNRSIERRKHNNYQSMDEVMGVRSLVAKELLYPEELSSSSTQEVTTDLF